MEKKLEYMGTREVSLDGSLFHLPSDFLQVFRDRNTSKGQLNERVHGYLESFENLDFYTICDKRALRLPENLSAVNTLYDLGDVIEMRLLNNGGFSIPGDIIEKLALRDRIILLGNNEFFNVFNPRDFEAYRGSFSVASNEVVPEIIRTSNGVSYLAGKFKDSGEEFQRSLDAVDLRSLEPERIETSHTFPSRYFSP